MYNLLFVILVLVHLYETSPGLPDTIRSELPLDINKNDPVSLVDWAVDQLQQRNFKQLEPVLKECIQLSQDQGNQKLLAYSRHYLADYYYSTNQFPEANRQYNENLPLFESLHDTLMIARTKSSISLIHHINKQYDKALAEYIELFDEISHYTKLGPLMKGEMLTVLLNITNLLMEIEEYEKVIAYSPKAIDLAHEVKDSVILGALLNTLGITYSNLRNFEKSRTYYTLAADIYQKSNNSFNLSFVHNNLGDLFIKKGEYDSALVYLNRSLEGFITNEYDIGVLSSQLGIAKVLHKSGRIDEARSMLHKTIENCTHQSHSQILSESYKEFASLEFQQEQYKEAYLYHVRYKELNDSLFDLQKQQQLVEMETLFDTKQKENEIEALKAQNQRNETIIKLNRRLSVMGWSVSLILVAFACTVLFQLRQKRKANLELKEQNQHIEAQNRLLNNLNQEMNGMNQKLMQSECNLKKNIKEKNQFLSILAHDVRNPFQSVLGYAELLYLRYDQYSDIQRKESIFEVYNSCKIVHHFFENLLSWSQSQNQGLNYAPFTFDLNSLVSHILLLNESTARKKEIQLINNILPGTKVNVDRAMFDTIIRNLVSNAIKFTPSGGFVRVSSEKKEDNLIICVEDNGIGISKKLADKLFRIDVSAKRPGTHDEKGTGLGLILCKEFVGYHKGNIWVQSKTGCGSKFFVSIPQTKCKVEEMFIN